MAWHLEPGKGEGRFILKTSNLIFNEDELAERGRDKGGMGISGWGRGHTSQKNVGSY